MLQIFSIYTKVLVWFELTRMLLFLQVGKVKDIFWDLVSFVVPQMWVFVIPLSVFLFFSLICGILCMLLILALCFIYDENIFFHLSLTIALFLVSFFF